jgi:hypothetical protein
MNTVLDREKSHFSDKSPGYALADNLAARRPYAICLIKNLKEHMLESIQYDFFYNL